MFGCRFARWLICENIDVPDNVMQQFRSISWAICIFIRLHMLSGCRYNWLCCSTPPEYPLRWKEVEKNFQAASERKNASLQADMALWRVQIYAYRVQRAGAATIVSFVLQHNHSIPPIWLWLWKKLTEKWGQSLPRRIPMRMYVTLFVEWLTQNPRRHALSLLTLYEIPSIYDARKRSAGAVFFPHTHGSWLIARQINLF